MKGLLPMKTLNVDDMAALFDERVETVRGWCREGKLTGVFRIGKGYKILESDLMAFIEAAKQPKMPA